MSAAHLAENAAARLEPVPAQDYPPCDECGAPLDDQQRYCVHCGGRRVDKEEPALAWMAERRSGAARTAARYAGSTPPRNPLALPALALALLPVAVGIGVLVGGHRGGTDQQLLEALRNQKAPIVKVGDVAAGSATTASVAGKTPRKAKAKTGKVDKSGGKVVAQTKYGVAHQVTGFKPTAAKINSDRKLVQHINKSIGKNYLQAQRNLPDTIVVPAGTGTGSSPGAQGRGD
jgi:hypothetical protein